MHATADSPSATISWTSTPLSHRAAHDRERILGQPPPEIRAQQELAMRGHARAHPDEAVLLGPGLVQLRRDRRVRDGELGLELKHDVGRVARADVPDADEGGGVPCGLRRERAPLRSGRVDPRGRCGDPRHRGHGRKRIDSIRARREARPSAAWFDSPAPRSPRAPRRCNPWARPTPRSSPGPGSGRRTKCPCPGPCPVPFESGHLVTRRTSIEIVRASESLRRRRTSAPARHRARCPGRRATCRTRASPAC